MDYAESCDLRSIMRNRNIAEYQKPCLMGITNLAVVNHVHMYSYLLAIGVSKKVDLKTCRHEQTPKDAKLHVNSAIVLFKFLLCLF